MTEPAGQPSKPLRTWRPMALWSAGILLALGLFWLGAQAWDIWITRKVLSHQNQPKETLDELGGPQRALPRLRTYLRLSDSLAPDKLTAVWAVGGCGPVAAPDLLLLMHHRLPDVRAIATYALGKLPSAEADAAPAVIQALADPEPRVRAAAARALGQIGSRAPELVPLDLLVNALKDPSPDVRQSASSALGQIGPPARPAVPALIAVLEDPEPELRSKAGQALVRIAPPPGEVVPALVALPRDITLNYHEPMWAALRIDPTAQEVAPALAARWKTTGMYAYMLRDIAGMILADLGPEGRKAVPALLAQLKDGDRGVRVLFLEFLARVRPMPRETVAAYITVLRDKKDEHLRDWAARFLADIGPGALEGVPDLIELLRDEDPFVRTIAAQALGRIGPAAGQAVPALTEALKDDEAKPRYAAADALEKIKIKEPPK